LKLDGVASSAAAQLWRLDADHGNVVKAFDAMGRPAFPTRDQITQLRKAGEPSPPEQASLKDGSLTVRIPPQGLVLIKINNARVTR
jgi:xylan 1,4-beta-xylosidase